MSEALGEVQQVGDRYCGELCGRGCTYNEFRAAHEGAAALCAKLGPGWKPRVWENLGWHYSAISEHGHIKVHPFKPEGAKGAVESYTAFFGRSGQAGGIWAGSAETPHEAVRQTIEKASNYRDFINELLAAAEGCLG